MGAKQEGQPLAKKQPVGLQTCLELYGFALAWPVSWEKDAPPHFPAQGSPSIVAQLRPLRRTWKEEAVLEATLLACRARGGAKAAERLSQG